MAAAASAISPAAPSPWAALVKVRVRLRLRVRVRARLRLRVRVRDRLAHGVHEAAHLVVPSTGREGGVRGGRSRERGVSRGLRH